MWAITLRPPYGLFIVRLLKKIETRTFRPQGMRKGDLLALHTSKAWNPDELAWIRSGRDLDAVKVRACLTACGALDVDAIPLGCVTGVSVFDSAHRTEAICAAPDLFGLDDTRLGIESPERFLGGYEGKRYGWQLPATFELPEPVPARGAQGIWKLPPEVAAKVRAQLTAAEWLAKAGCR